MKKEKLLLSRIYPSHVTEFLQKFMSFSEKQLQEQKKQLNIIRQRRDGVTPSISPCMIYYRDVRGKMRNKIKQMIMESKFKRVTPQNIENLADNEVFVFGSNMAGRHGKGAAKTALKWGAKYGQGVGLQGRTYGIPTMNGSITRKLSLEVIGGYVDEFIGFAVRNPEKTFLVTEIGCGLAGYDVNDIAPLFVRAIGVDNIHLPMRFWHKLLN
jgi:hypothetical protein